VGDLGDSVGQARDHQVDSTKAQSLESAVGSAYLRWIHILNTDLTLTYNVLKKIFKLRTRSKYTVVISNLKKIANPQYLSRLIPITVSCPVILEATHQDSCKVNARLGNQPSMIRYPTIKLPFPALNQHFYP
jgi:hypothetical protein